MPFDPDILLHSRNLSIGYRNGSTGVLLSDLNLQISRGQMITLIGPNGVGKSTLIKNLIGFLPPLEGEIFLNNQTLESVDAAKRARNMGVVLTEPVYETNLTVFEIVAAGRYQHTNWIGRLDEQDSQFIETAIRNVGLEHKTHNRIGELSDGERQRALIARVLAQDVDLIILDEPTAHLDLPNRMEILLLLRKFAHTQGKGILISTHELGLALQVSDKIWLINNMQELKQELPERLIIEGELDRTFGNDHIAFRPSSATFEVNPTTEVKVCVTGDSSHCQCIVRMLVRLGYFIVEKAAEADITIMDDFEAKKIKLTHKEQVQEMDSLEQLNTFLVALIQNNK